MQISPVVDNRSSFVPLVHGHTRNSEAMAAFHVFIYANKSARLYNYSGQEKKKRQWTLFLKNGTDRQRTTVNVSVRLHGSPEYCHSETSANVRPNYTNVTVRLMRFN